MTHRLLETVTRVIALFLVLGALGVAGSFVVRKDPAKTRSSGGGLFSQYVYGPVGWAIGLKKTDVTRAITKSTHFPFGPNRSLDGSAVPNDYVRRVRDDRIQREWKESWKGFETNLDLTNFPLGKTKKK